MTQHFSTNEHVEHRLTAVNTSFMNFFNIANAGDLNSAYRSRSIWTKYKASDIIKPTEELLVEVPSARSAVLYFISNLVHENIHHYFCEKERNDSMAIDYGSLEVAVRTLVAKLRELRADSNSSTFSLNLLTWLFELFSDLCRQNNNRPFFNHQRPSPQVILRIFQQNPCIADLLILLEATFTFLLNSSPDKAIHSFITAHKMFLNNFDWITIYIMDSFPPDTVNHLIRTGASEFQTFCKELLLPTNAQRISQLQEDYAAKLRLFGDIFQYMGRSNRIELRNCFFSIIRKFARTGENFTELVFLLKLIFFAPEIVLPFTDELIQLVINPHFIDQLYVFNQNTSLRIAVSHPAQMQNFFAKILEKASTNSILALLEFISPLIHGHLGFC